MARVRTTKAARENKSRISTGAPAIRIVEVTKRYRRVAQSHKFLTLKSAFVGGNLFKLLNADEVFTALEGVTLDIRRGETFGVIGPNGAGKSTLMKIVAGTTKPTEGAIEMNGKVSALIELGAGFHPEISGRENVYINGIMLGLSRQQVEERFDDIVAFAELEEFIDAPVKNYSSGMYMRLGFSVAIHVDPDILVVDEVLAVGDEAFVHKCLDKIGEFKRRGKTILLVTHGMDTVRRMCDRAAWIHEGRVAKVGDPMRVVDEYLNFVAEHEEAEMARIEKQRIDAVREKFRKAPAEETAPAPPAATSTDIAAAEDRAETRTDETDEAPASSAESVEAPYEPGRWGNRAVSIDDVRFVDADGRPGHVFTCGDAMSIEMDWRAEDPVEDFVFGIGLFNANGVSCYGTNTDIERFEGALLRGAGTASIRIPALNLVSGTYYLDVAVHRVDGNPYDYHRGLYSFRVNSRFGDVGVARLPHEWQFSASQGEVRWQRVGGMAASGDRESSPREEDS